jgi:hypothetical protein
MAVATTGAVNALTAGVGKPAAGTGVCAVTIADRHPFFQISKSTDAAATSGVFVSGEAAGNKSLTKPTG